MIFLQLIQNMPILTTRNNILSLRSAQVIFSSICWCLSHAITISLNFNIYFIFAALRNKNVGDYKLDQKHIQVKSTLQCIQAIALVYVM